MSTLLPFMTHSCVMPYSDEDFYSRYSQDQVRAWMLTMSTYPPPPPDQQHYTAQYPTYGLDQAAVYPKVEPDTTPDQRAAPHSLQNLNMGLPRQASFDEQQHHQLQQANAQLQHHMTAAPGVANASQVQPQQATSENAKSNRLRKACDSCSIRKVKCDETGPPCRACAVLEIPCTFDRPSRRRGPPNRHADAIKRRRLEDGNGSPHLTGSAPSSPMTGVVHPSFTSGYEPSAESICPVETLDLLIDDFFTYIHPLCPFPHEPSFREAWKRREDRHNKPFLALLASMIGALVSSFPRKPRQHLKAQNRQHLYPNHLSLVKQCHKVCAAARGAGYLESEELNVYDAATSYFLAMMGTYTFRWQIGRLYFGECLNIIRTLGLHKPRGESFTPLGSLQAAVGSQRAGNNDDRDQSADYITQEMGRRIFWTMFVSVKSIQQLGASFGELVIPPPTPTEPYPPLPLELDDFCIYPDKLEPQPPSLVSTMVGFNANIKVFSSCNAVATMEMAWGIDAVVDWDRQKRVLQEALRRCKLSIRELPSELTVYPQAAHSQEHLNGDGSHPTFAPLNGARDNAQMHMRPADRTPSPTERRHTQHEIEKANIYASSLLTRSYIVEKYFNLCEAHDRSRGQLPASLPSSPGIGITAAGIDGMLPQAPTSHFEKHGPDMRQEREDIIKDLLVVLCSIHQVNMEPNGDSFTMKIRSIASTLLDVPDTRKGPVHLKAQEYLSQFLKILMRLERVAGEDDRPDDEEAELRHWADLKDYQLKFVQQGGLTGMS